MAALSRRLKESWALVEDRSDRVAGYLYARIFTRQPEMRELFPLHMDIQRERLVAAIVRAIQTVDSTEQFDSYLRRLGAEHRKYGVRPEHFEVFGECLVESVRVHAGSAWNHGYEMAWRELFDGIAERMIAGAAEDAHNPAYWEAEVRSHERRSHDIAVFTVRPALPLPYRAGQQVSLESPYQPRTWRRYPIANAPHPDGEMEFHVRAAGHSVVSSSLVWKLVVGDTVRLGPASGGMEFDLASPRDLVCVAGGTGLAPIKALVEELGKSNRTRWVHIFFGARNCEDLYDLPALRGLAARCPWLSLVPAVSEDAGAGEEKGLISDVVTSYGPWHNHDFYVCGSPEMVRATLARLREMQVPRTRINHEAHEIS